MVYTVEIVVKIVVTVCAGCVLIGHTVVYAAIVMIVTDPVGQFVMVDAQLVMVDVIVA